MANGKSSATAQGATVLLPEIARKTGEYNAPVGSIKAGVGFKKKIKKLKSGESRSFFVK